MKIIKLIVGNLQANCFILINKKDECLIIDPGDDGDLIIQTISDERVKPLAILANSWTL